MARTDRDRRIVERRRERRLAAAAPIRQRTTRSLLVRYSLSATALALTVAVALTAVSVELITTGRRRAADRLEQVAGQQLEDFGIGQARTIETQLRTISYATRALADAFRAAYDTPYTPPAGETDRYVLDPNGVYRTAEDNGNAALFYSGVIPVGPEQRAKAARLAQVDPVMKALVRAHPLIAQVYINTWDSMNRIYPYFDVKSQYSPKMDIPKFNFYYEADAIHDPKRLVRWTDAYLDPAGQGWMISAIAPVYRGDFLEGVVGIDITIGDLVSGLLSSKSPYGGASILVDRNHVIMAMPRKAEEYFRLGELTSDSYGTYVLQDTFKPARFDLDLRPDTRQLSRLLGTHQRGSGNVTIGGRSFDVSWHGLARTGGHVITMAERSRVEAPAADISQQVRTAEIAAVIALIVSAFALAVVLRRRSRRLALTLTGPLREITGAMSRIAGGDFHPSISRSEVAELDRAGQSVLELGLRLEESRRDSSRAQRELALSESRYRSIFDSVAQPVLAVHADGRIEETNTAAEELFAGGVPLRAGNILELLPLEQWPSPSTRLTWTHPDGRQLVLDILVSSPADATSGDPSADDLHTVAVRDLTAAMETQRRLEDARENAEHTARLKDEFLATMSHEIRTPLNGVVGMIDLLAQTRLDDEQRRHLHVAERAGRDLQQLVDDVLDFARLESGRIQLDEVDTSPEALVRGVVELLAPLAAPNGVEVRVHVDDHMPLWMRFDPTRVRQILTNLVGNAVKFTQQGTVTVSLRLAAATSGEEPSGPLDPASTFLRFEVADTGIGIAHDVIPDLFSAFNQGDRSMVRRFGGTGLGLAIAKRLAELMGGSIGVSSELGVGSTFWFTVRVHPGVEPARAELGADLAAGLHVLVAEDNEVNIMVIETFLRRLGHVVTTVRNGREAVRAVENASFDIVLMDIQMPVMDGVQATRLIRALPEPKSLVPIVAVTADALPRQRDAYLAAGMDAHLAKPIDSDRLATTIALVTRPGGPPSRTSTDVDRASVEPEAPVLDLQVISSMRQELGDAVVDGVIGAFLASLDPLLARIAGPDDEQANRSLHSLAGAAAAVGAAALRVAATTAWEAEPNRRGSLLERVRALAAHTRIALSSLPGSPRA